MSSVTKSGNQAHDNACLPAESAYQVAVSAAAMSAAGQAAINAAAITWARAVVASAKANNGGFGVEPAVSLLKTLGTGGT